MEHIVSCALPRAEALRNAPPRRSNVQANREPRPCWNGPSSCCQMLLLHPPGLDVDLRYQVNRASSIDNPEATTASSQFCIPRGWMLTCHTRKRRSA
jgi:hypothetical protein